MHDAYVHFEWHKQAMLDPQFAALSFVQHVLDETGLTPTGLAKKAGISSTTLTRPINNPDHKYAISTSTISKIAAVTGINPAPFFETSNVAKQQAEIINDANRRFDFKGKFAPQQGKNQFLLPIGIINTGQWRDNNILNPAIFQPLLVTHSWIAHEDVFAIAVVDDRANQIAMPGEFLICSSFEAGKELIKLSNIVIVQKLSDGGRKIQLISCYTERFQEYWSMYPTSDRDDIREPFVMPDLEREFNGMQVIGIVHYVVRPPHRLRDA